MQRRRRDARVDAAAPQNATVDRNLEVGRGLRFLTGTGCVFVVVQNPRVDVDRGERVNERGDRTVALTGDGVLDAVERDVSGDPVDHAAVHRRTEQLQAAGRALALRVRL